jgi:hypothetical protein
MFNLLRNIFSKKRREKNGKEILDKYNYWRNLTWKCGVCGKEREDRFISVLTYPLKDLPGGFVNLKYCNDNPDCLKLAQEKAKTEKI